MGESIVETKIASNIESQSQAFNDAEATLRDAERALANLTSDSTTFDFTATNDGFYHTDPNISSLTWNDDDSEGSGYDRFVRQYVGQRTLAAESVAMTSNGGISGSSVHVFQISALSLQEAQSSSEIENIITTQDALYKYQIQPHSTDPVSKEVAYYAEALDIGFRQGD